MEKTKVKLHICGTDYTISSAEDDADYMRTIGVELDEKMHELQEENPRLSITQCAVLCALDYLEDAARARTDSEITKRELDRVAKELAALRAKQG